MESNNSSIKLAIRAIRAKAIARKEISNFVPADQVKKDLLKESDRNPKKIALDVDSIYLQALEKEKAFLNDRLSGKKVSQTHNLLKSW